MAVSAREEIDAVLDELPDENLEVLLRVLRRLRRGEPLRRWSAAIGRLSETDAEDMLRAIEEGCERVDPESW
jgi:hypothetical protein